MMQAVPPRAETFWSDFLVARSKARILLLPALFPEPLATEQELFDLVLRLRERHVPTPDDSKFKVYINHKLVTADILRAAPVPSDSTFHGYAQRLENEFDAKQYLFFLEDIHRYSVPIWLRTCSILKELFVYTGLPASHATVELFAGKYTQTSGGVHRELCGNFQYVVYGDKTMKVWDPDVFDPGQCYLKRPNGEQYLLDEAVKGKENLCSAATARPGETMYWSARHWHIGESPKFTIALTIALYMENNLVDVTLDLLRQKVLQAPSVNVTSYSLPFANGHSVHKGAAVPLNPHQKIYDELLCEVNSGVVQECIEDAWYQRVSALGFEWTPDPMEENPVLNGGVLRLQAPAGIFYRCTKNGVKVFANGITLETKISEAEIQSLIDRLGSGEDVTLGTLLPVVPGTNGSGEKLRSLLEWLVRVHAVQVLVA